MVVGIGLAPMLFLMWRLYRPLSSLLDVIPHLLSSCRTHPPNHGTGTGSRTMFRSMMVEKIGVEPTSLFAHCIMLLLESYCPAIRRHQHLLIQRPRVFLTEDHQSEDWLRHSSAEATMNIVHKCKSNPQLLCSYGILYPPLN